MKHRMLTLAALLVFFTGAAASLHAQVRFGAQASWGDNSDFGIGARLEHGLAKLFPNAPLRAAASFDYFFPGNSVTYWELNYNVFYQLKADALTPYAGLDWVSAKLQDFTETGSSPGNLVTEELGSTERASIDITGSCLDGGPLAATLIGYPVTARGNWWGTPAGPAPGRVLGTAALDAADPLPAEPAHC